MTPSLHPNCVPQRLDFSLGNRQKSDGAISGENGGEEGLRIGIQSQQSWQLATCEQAHCPARAEHLESIDALSSLNTVIQKQSSVTKCFLLSK